MQHIPFDIRGTLVSNELIDQPLNKRLRTDVTANFYHFYWGYVDVD